MWPTEDCDIGASDWHSLWSHAKWLGGSGHDMNQL